MTNKNNKMKKLILIVLLVIAGIGNIIMSMGIFKYFTPDKIWDLGNNVQSAEYLRLASLDKTFFTVGFVVILICALSAFIVIPSRI